MVIPLLARGRSRPRARRYQPSAGLRIGPLIGRVAEYQPSEEKTRAQPLAVDESFAGLALRLQRTEFLIEPLLEGDRPVLQQLLADITAGRADTILSRTPNGQRC